MAYQVLARKWRPKTFADLIGQEHVVKALRNALDEGRLHHAYLLTGTRGVGKTTIARILAKSLNCEHADRGEPCGVCQSCTQIDAGHYVDLLEIDAASNTGIDNIREVLENAQYAPTAGKYKVYIIDEVHMLSKSAFNAMLKTLEEPPEHVKFILATTDPHKVPVTVLSRCLQFVLRNMTTQQVADHLAHVLDSENISYEATALQLLGRAAAGSMRDALSLLDQAIAMGSGNVAEYDVRQMIGAVDKCYLYELLQSVANQDGGALLNKAQEMAARAIGFDSALGELAMLLQRLALIQIVPSAVANDDPEREALLQLSRAMSGEQIQLYYQCVIHGKQDLILAPDEYAGFVMTLLRMLAFAPLAAQAHGVNDMVEHTQLQESGHRETAVKKLLSIPPPSENKPNVQAASAAVVPSENVLKTKDIPPWEEPPVHVTVEAEPLQTAPSRDELPVVPQEADPSMLENERIQSRQHMADIQTASDKSHMPSEPGNKEMLPPYFGQEDSEPHDFINEPPYTPPMPPVEDEESHEVGDEEEDEPQFIALPDFKPENWAVLVQRFAKRFGAAQMLAQHAVWVGYDSGNHLMTLSLTNEAKATTNKERLDKIRNVLAAAYNLPLKLQTQPWHDGQGWETPAMRRQRLQEEGRQQAQDLLAADPTAQQILKTFDAQWLPDTLELKQPSES
ncbi:DNA polymerase III subunit gamma/tau [Neisseria iguanae]|uniref:DNA polymerase III subunit gamma/tau n=1 Tax=Neisseria iguanae TaxID=90242 RepID=A0A2P7U0V0_9NEIS|nr:DNA polymerase III subunit gamma/tau [Neisseria iguanae]PSJ80618.1 DNA polymerase III subunit gamma/tau [Neisseria iguanae]